MCPKSVTWGRFEAFTSIFFRAMTALRTLSHSLMFSQMETLCMFTIDQMLHKKHFGVFQSSLFLQPVCIHRTDMLETLQQLLSSVLLCTNAFVSLKVNIPSCRMSIDPMLYIGKYKLWDFFFFFIQDQTQM